MIIEPQSRNQPKLEAALCAQLAHNWADMHQPLILELQKLPMTEKLFRDTTIQGDRDAQQWRASAPNLTISLERWNFITTADLPKVETFSGSLYVHPWRDADRQWKIRKIFHLAAEFDQSQKATMGTLVDLTVTRLGSGVHQASYLHRYSRNTPMGTSPKQSRTRDGPALDVLILDDP